MANKQIGSIQYSLSQRVKNPSEEEAEKGIAASLQARDVIGLNLLARHMREHGSSFSVGTLQGVLADMVDCTIEMLKAGYAVNFEGLAKFYLTCKSDYVEDVEDFNPAVHIKKIYVRADIDSAASSSVNTNPDFEYAMTRKEQADAKKAAKAALGTEGSGDVPSGNGDNGGTDDNGEGITG